MTPEPPHDGFHDVSAVTIKIFINHEMAGLASASLEAHGIACWINSDDGGGMMPHLTAPGGVRLLVRTTDAEAALALLNTSPMPSEMPFPIETDIPEKVAPRKKPVFGQLFIVIILGIILCLGFQWIEERGTTIHYHYFHGQIDEKWVYHNGRLFEHFMDRNHDGVWDHWAYYDDRAYLIRSEYDNNFDGKPDETWTYSDGVLASMEKDTDFNGVPDEFCTYKDNIIQEAKMKPNGSKFVTAREFFKNGVLTEARLGGDSNGNFKEIIHYDPFWNPVSTNTPSFDLPLTTK